jgi:molybdopterin molybdotransferase
MLTYDEAVARRWESVPGPLPIYSEFAGLEYVLGRSLAVPIFADQNLPPFDNSAVDGFAVRLADAKEATADNPVALRITETIAAGYVPTHRLNPGEAARIYTGAMMPDGADAVIMVEDTATEGDTVHLRMKPSASFIRRAGSDVAVGTVAIPEGTVINAGVAGLIASLSQFTIPLHHRPRIGIISTGDELVPPFIGQPLQPGQIYESNGMALTAAAISAGSGAVNQVSAKDTPEDTKYALDALRESHIIIASGGVSVGDRDFVRSVVEEHGELNFWRVAIKPGKPLAFGRYGNALFFGLPGNPVSSLVTFELFVRPVIRKLAGFRDVTRPMVSAILDEPLRHEPGRREFVRARLTWQDDTYHATTTGAQGSHRLSSLLGADAFLVAHEDHGDYAAGERLPAMLLR